MIFFKNLKLHDISMTGKAPFISLSFPGFPAADDVLDVKFRTWYITILLYHGWVRVFEAWDV